MLDSNIHISYKIVLRPRINMRRGRWTIRVKDTLQEDIRWSGLYKVKWLGDITKKELSR
ncbi:hypothetical protein BDR06DRAFT_957746 [Suillus hirtellus]|nr:hypothetical protein BDR06DRAFT_957746 [Suillus hirtellus]